MADSILSIEHIVSTPGVMGGQPRIAGQRVSVANIAVLHEWHHWDAQRIADELGLSLAQVYAALAYYFDHRAEIDSLIEADEKTIKEAGISMDALRHDIELRSRKNG